MLKLLNLVLRFLLEICILIALGYWGFNSSDETLPRIAAGIGAPLLAAINWGIFVAPASRRRLRDPLRLLVEIVIFAAAVLALAAAGQLTLALIFAVVTAINISLVRLWKQ